MTKNFSRAIFLLVYQSKEVKLPHYSVTVIVGRLAACISQDTLVRRVAVALSKAAVGYRHFEGALPVTNPDDWASVDTEEAMLQTAERRLFIQKTKPHFLTRKRTTPPPPLSVFFSILNNMVPAGIYLGCRWYFNFSFLTIYILTASRALWQNIIWFRHGPGSFVLRQVC